MELEVKPDKKLVDGQHLGVIKAIEYREKPYAYTDLIIEVEGITLKAGYPTIVTPESKLGQLLTRFSINVLVGSKVDPDKVFIGKKCTFLTMSKATPKGTFANIIVDSVKPA